MVHCWLPLEGPGSEGRARSCTPLSHSSQPRTSSQEQTGHCQSCWHLGMIICSPNVCINLAWYVNCSTRSEEQEQRIVQGGCVAGRHLGGEQQAHKLAAEHPERVCGRHALLGRSLVPATALLTRAGRSRRALGWRRAPQPILHRQTRQLQNYTKDLDTDSDVPLVSA